MVLSSLQTELTELESAVDEEKQIYESKYLDVETHLKEVAERHKRECDALKCSIARQRKEWEEKIKGTGAESARSLDGPSQTAGVSQI